MSNLVKKDAGSGVVENVMHDGVTAAVTVATVVAYMALPVFGWLALAAGGGYLGVRAVKKGLKKR